VQPRHHLRRVHALLLARLLFPHVLQHVLVRVPDVPDALL